VRDVRAPQSDLSVVGGSFVNMGQVRTYAEVAPPVRLGADVQCLWWSAFSGVTPILPDGCLDLIVTREPDRVFVAGPDTRAVLAEPMSTPTYGIRFRPGRAHRVLGLPASELLDQRIDLADLWGAEGARQTERLLAGPEQLAAVVAERLARTRYEPDSLVDEAIRRLLAGGPRVSAVVGDLPVSERHFRRSFTASVGYGPATFLRVARLQRARHLALARPAVALAELAFEAGYTDQAHLSRDLKDLTGSTPSQLLR
jgi:AraC-like DNA-binding protein